METYQILSIVIISVGTVIILGITIGTMLLTQKRIKKLEKEVTKLIKKRLEEIQDEE